jgi:hypothetical protein
MQYFDFSSPEDVYRLRAAYGARVAESLPSIAVRDLRGSLGDATIPVPKNSIVIPRNPCADVEGHKCAVFVVDGLIVDDKEQMSYDGMMIAW